MGVSKNTYNAHKEFVLQALHFLKWLLLFLICIPLYLVPIVGKEKSSEVFMQWYRPRPWAFYLSHKDLGRESFHKRTCNFVQGGLHVKVSCAYGGNLPCVRHIFNCCKVPLYVGYIPSVRTLPYTWPLARVNQTSINIPNEGWMPRGQQTIFHWVPISQLTMVVSWVSTFTT